MRPLRKDIDLQTCRRMRDEEGLSQKQIAEALGVSPRWCRGGSASDAGRGKRQFPSSGRQPSPLWRILTTRGQRNSGYYP